MWRSEDLLALLGHYVAHDGVVFLRAQDQADRRVVAYFEPLAVVPIHVELHLAACRPFGAEWISTLPPQAEPDLRDVASDADQSAA